MTAFNSGKNMMQGFDVSIPNIFQTSERPFSAGHKPNKKRRISQEDFSISLAGCRCCCRSSFRNFLN